MLCTSRLQKFVHRIIYGADATFVTHDGSSKHHRNFPPLCILSKLGRSASMGAQNDKNNQENNRKKPNFDLIKRGSVVSLRTVGRLPFKEIANNCQMSISEARKIVQRAEANARRYGGMPTDPENLVD